MPNSTAGLQPYQLMFGCKFQTPCDSQLGVNNCNSNESVFKSYWMQEHQKLMQVANQYTSKSTQKVQNRVLSKEEERNHPSQRVIWSYCRITPKVVIKSKTILKTKNFLWWNNSVNLMSTELNQSIVLVQSGLITTDNCKTFRKPIMTVITPVMKKWAIYPPLILKLNEKKHPYS